jgi:alkylation response protein AidB-like acyl-CoA dehydrogenase
MICSSRATAAGIVRAGMPNPYGLSDEQLELQAVCREFAANEIRPLARRYDGEDHDVPFDLVRKAAEVGLTSFMLPAEYGGGGITDALTHCVVTEALAWGDAPLGNFITSGGFFAATILALGSDDQKQRYIPPLCGPDPVFAALATTEPGAGSDAAAMTTQARRVDGGYVLDGQKTWISNGGISEYYLVFATVAPGTRSKGVTAFVVHRDDPGISWGAPLAKMGQRAIPTTEVFLSDCFVAEDRRIGAEGQGFYGLMGTFDASRVTLGAASVGIGTAAIEYAVQYAREREAFGQPISNYQAVSFRIADAAMKVEQARLLVYHAARLIDQGGYAAKEAAMAKVCAAEAGVFAADCCVKTLGGYGYSPEYPAEKWLRDAKLDELWEGTSDIMRLIVSRELFRG